MPIDGGSSEEGPSGVTAPTSGEHRFLARVPRRRLAFELAYLLATVAAAALALSLAGRRPGWPVGQTFGQDPLLVQIYAAHYRHGDFLPVWSSSDAYGFGTPVPLFYHKAFFVVGATVYLLLGGALKPTLVITLAAFMVVGAYGMRKALSVITGDRVLQVVGSLAFLFTNWSFVEWLSRGDLAEFSALMVVPWLLYWCLTLVKERRVSWSVVPTMVVLVDAHSAVALVSTVVIAVTGIVFLASYGGVGVRAVYRRLVVAVGATAVILAPMLIAELKMSRDYDPASKITEFGADVAHHFVAPWWGYLYLPAYRWLSPTNANLDVQLDFLITALLVAGLITVTVRWSRRPSTTPASAVDRPVLAVLALSLGAYLFMQFRVSLPVYDVLAPFKVITFPYRMMTFITPLALLLAGLVADWYVRLARQRWPVRVHWVPPALAVLWLALLVLLGPVTAHEPPSAVSLVPNAPFLPVEALTAPAKTSVQHYPDVFVEYGPMFIEYLPKVNGADGHELRSDSSIYQKLHADHGRDASLSSVPCTVTERSGTGFESLRQTYVVKCAGPTLVALPISYNSFTRVGEVGRDGQVRPVAVHHVPTDPRLVVRVDNDAPHLLAVDLPTLAQILFP